MYYRIYTRCCEKKVGEYVQAVLFANFTFRHLDSFIHLDNSRDTLQTFIFTLQKLGIAFKMLKGDFSNFHVGPNAIVQMIKPNLLVSEGHMEPIVFNKLIFNNMIESFELGSFGIFLFFQ